MDFDFHFFLMHLNSEMGWKFIFPLEFLPKTVKLGLEGLMSLSLSKKSVRGKLLNGTKGNTSTSAFKASNHDEALEDNF